MGVAAQVAARRLRRYGQTLWPSRPSGEQPTGLPQVELYLGGWVDVTAQGLVRYKQGIKVTRGQPDENQRTNPGTATFRLKNLDGRFSPRNPLGPYYGVIDKNTPCRISVPSGNGKSYRFCGEVASWPADWDPTGNDSWVDIQAAGILRRLGAGNGQPLRSAPFLYWAGATGSAAAVAYWPMEDGTGATQFASGLTYGRPMTITGTPSLANTTSIAPSAALPSFTSGASALAQIPTYTPGSGGFTGVTCYVAVPSGGESSQVLLSIASTGVYPVWELYYVSTGGGQLGFRSRNSSGAIVLDSSSGPTPTPINGVPVIVCMDTWWDGTNAGFDLLTQVVTPGGAQFFYQQETAAASVGRITSIKVAPAAALTGTAIGHLAVAPQAGYAPVNDYQGNPGEPAAYRFFRLCNLANIPNHIVYDTVTQQLGPVMGPQHPGKLLDLLQESVDADGGIMFELTDRVGLGYRTRDTLCNQSPALTLDYPSAQLADVPKPVDDDTFTRNSITANRLNGSSALAQQTTGPLNLQTPPAGVGEYDTAATVNVEYDSQLADQAGWRLHLGTVPEPRYPVLGVQLSSPEILASPTLRQQILAVTPGDRMTVTNPPTWLPPDPISELAIGWTEDFDKFQHHIQFNSRPESPFRVAVTDDAVLGHADTDGSTLAQPVTATAATVTVATTNSASPTWTTRPSDYPFDLAVGGEQMMAVAPGTALNADPGMANGLTSYTLFHSGGGVDGTYQYLAGRNPILVVPDGTDTQGGLNGHITGVGSVTPAATYTVCCWVYCPQGWTDVRACIDWYDNTGTFLSTSLGSSSSIPAAAWTFISQDLTAVASASQCQPRFRWGTSAPATVQFWVYTLPVVADSTVSAVSPQTLTVARSMNGVVKPQAQGTNVQLFQPATLAIK